MLLNEIQKDLNTTGKKDASTEENKDFINRRYQYQQLIPNHDVHSSNQLSAGTDEPTRRELIAPQSDDRYPPKFQATYFHCNRMDTES